MTGGDGRPGEEDAGVEGEADRSAPADGWPVEWDGVVESVVTTPGPEGRWNVAALGLHAPGSGDGGYRGSRAGSASESTADRGPVTARTWGRTRTWRNFTDRGEGYVQFTDDPVDFVEAACSVREEPEPVLDSAAARVRVAATAIKEGSEAGTPWTDWALHPEEAAVERRDVSTLRRGRAAVVEATVAASRLDVPGYDAGDLRDRIRYSASVVETAGGPRDREAWRRFEELVDWRADGQRRPDADSGGLGG